MAMPQGPLRAQASELDPLEEEWERFQANGCPDWWLLAKYVGQAARSFPYQPFRPMSSPGAFSPTSAQAAAGPSQPAGLEMQHAGSAQHSTAGAAGAVQPVPSAAGKQPTTSSMEAAVSSSCSPAAAAAVVPDALPTFPCRPAAAATSAAAPTPANCGLKGIFGPCTACAPIQETDQAV